MAGAIILLYHRVTSLDSDPQLLSVSPDNFANHLEIIKNSYTVLSLPQLVEGLLQNALPDKSVAITFDDGYADNLYNALPLLTHFCMPATFFITSGQIGAYSEFWWDDLERCLLLQPSRSVNGRKFHYKDIHLELPQEFLAQTDEAERTSHSDWNVLSPIETPWQKVYIRLNAIIRSLVPEEQHEIMAMIRDCIGLPGAGRSRHRAMQEDELLTLAKSPLATIGCHTVSHPVLSGLTPQCQKNEICEARKKLEQMIDKPVTCFSYPFGGRKDYTAETVAILRNSGFDCGCANFPARISSKTDPFQLPRFLVRDWRPREFSRHLVSWFSL